MVLTSRRLRTGMVLAVWGLISLAPLTARAEIRTVHVEFSYGGTATAYRLYLSGHQVCETSSGLVTVMDCQVDVAVGSNSFTLRAVGADGLESAPSPPYIAIWTGEQIQSQRVLEIGGRNRQPQQGAERQRVAPAAGRERGPAENQQRLDRAPVPSGVRKRIQ